jgi:antitoxin (DNA-binding transcriptional repressor) of toxin-antitoxin stability system
MKKYTVSNAREHFAEILDSVEQGEEVTVTRHGSPVARITRPPVSAKRAVPPGPGFLKAQGWTVSMAEDFDAIPEGFEEYS